MSEKDDNSLPVINPREILAYLNEMGIRNISGEHLKEFIHDLKKLIKYESQLKKTESLMRKTDSVAETKTSAKGPERLHSCSTFSSRLKSKNKSEPKKPNTCLRDINTYADTKPSTVENSKDIKANGCCKKGLNMKETKSSSLASKRKKNNKENIPHNTNFIRVPILEQTKKCDPVSLYHHYTALWEKYKSNLPGENSWADLRWSVRERLLTAKQPQTRTKILSQESLEKRRNGWTE